MTDIAKIRAVIKAAKEKAEREKIVNPNQQVILTPDGGIIRTPGLGPRQFEEFEPIEVPGEPMSEMLIRDRR